LLFQRSLESRGSATESPSTHPPEPLTRIFIELIPDIASSVRSTKHPDAKGLRFTETKAIHPRNLKKK